MKKVLFIFFYIYLIRGDFIGEGNLKNKMKQLIKK